MKVKDTSVSQKKLLVTFRFVHKYTWNRSSSKTNGYVKRVVYKPWKLSCHNNTFGIKSVTIPQLFFFLLFFGGFVSLFFLNYFFEKHRPLCNSWTQHTIGQHVYLTGQRKNSLDLWPSGLNLLNVTLCCCPLIHDLRKYIYYYRISAVLYLF